MALPFARRVLHYARLDALRKKVPRLLAEFDFAPLGELLDTHLARAAMPVWAVGPSTPTEAGDGLCVQ